MRGGCFPQTQFPHITIWVGNSVTREKRRIWKGEPWQREISSSRQTGAFFSVSSLSQGIFLTLTWNVVHLCNFENSELSTVIDLIQAQPTREIFICFKMYNFSLLFLLLEIQNFLGWSRIGISTLHSFSKVGVHMPGYIHPSPLQFSTWRLIKLDQVNSANILFELWYLLFILSLFILICCRGDRKLLVTPTYQLTNRRI